MFKVSYFQMLEDYKSKGFQTHCTNALVEGIKKNKKDWEDLKENIELAFKTYSKEGSQTFYVASYIKDEILIEVEGIQEEIEKEVPHESRHSLYGFLSEIMYWNIDYYEVAKQLTKYYKESQKTKLKKVA